MNGRVLDYSAQTNSGLITGDDGNRYNFVGTEWKDQANPNRGMRVDFEAQGSDAVAIYRATPAPGTGGIGGTLEGVMGSEKTKVVAGLLGIFLGWAGAHKFYLGFKKPAIIQLAVGVSRAERNQAVWRSKSVPLERRCSAKMSAYDGCRREPLVAARLVEPMRQGNRWLSAW